MSSLTKNWQKDYKERCKFLFNSSTLSDVKFVVQASQKNGESAEIPAHKFLLSICSPVFFAMFCGEMAETKEHINLPDCEYEVMLELLRYIYTDEVCLNGNNVMQVLYLAEKYMIPCLTDECTEYLGKNLDLSNVFCVLQHAQQFENKNLLFCCWDLIDNETEEALKSSEFLSVERSFLNQLVERNTLSIREVELFKAVDCWANEECKRQQLNANGSIKRQVLGEEIVKKIRFPIMKENEFKDVVLPSQILAKEDTSNIMEYFSRADTSAVGFLDVERLGPLLRCCRFKSLLRGTYHENDPDEDDWLSFTVDEDIILHGISLFGNDGGTFTVTLTILISFEDDFDEVYQTGTFTSGRRECSAGFYYGFDVLLDEPFAVKKDGPMIVSIRTLVDGPSNCIGNEVHDIVDVSGVEFDLGPQWNERAVPLSRCAELLFRLKE